VVPSGFASKESAQAYFLGYNMEWYNIFSYWAFIFWIAWILKLSTISPRLILMISMVGTIIFLFSNYNSPTPVALFIFATHAIPLLISRKSPIDIHGTAIIIIAYMTFLYLQGTNPLEVYEWVFNNPPATIHEYMKRRGLINFN
jgi:hypothetical protein